MLESCKVPGRCANFSSLLKLDVLNKNVHIFKFIIRVYCLLEIFYNLLYIYPHLSEQLVPGIEKKYD